MAAILSRSGIIISGGITPDLEVLVPPARVIPPADMVVVEVPDVQPEQTDAPDHPVLGQSEP